MINGTVKFFNDGKGYGFISPDQGGKDAFVHVSALAASGMNTLRDGQRVSYDLQEEQTGKMSAVNLREADGAAPASDGTDKPDAE